MEHETGAASARPSIEVWQQRISEWRKTGISIAEWCRENQIVYHQFIYWKGRLQPAKTNSSSLFTELQDDTPQNSGIVIEVAQARIHLTQKFDPYELKRCIQMLREIT